MFRTYLPGVILKNILDVLDRGFQVLKAGGLLVLKFVLELGSKLSIAYKEGESVSIIRLKISFWASDGSKSKVNSLSNNEEVIRSRFRCS
jgi:hypothetical protein